MHPIRIGRIVRSLRRRLGWRQIDLAKRAGVSQQTVSRVERGRIDELSFGALGRLLEELEAELELNVRWRGGELDRVIDEGHAHLVAAVIELLETGGWTAVPEVTYLFGRDRGSIDVLGHQPTAGAVLVIEVKTELNSVEATPPRPYEKVRHAADISRSRFGWNVTFVSRLLVLPDSSTPRRRIARHAALLDRTFPTRGSALRAWLRSPTPSPGGLMFLSPTRVASARRDLASRRRISEVRGPGAEHSTTLRGRYRTVGFIDSSVEHSPSE